MFTNYISVKENGLDTDTKKEKKKNSSQLRKFNLITKKFN